LGSLNTELIFVSRIWIEISVIEFACRVSLCNQFI